MHQPGSEFLQRIGALCRGAAPTRWWLHMLPNWGQGQPGWTLAVGERTQKAWVHFRGYTTRVDQEWAVKLLLHSLWTGLWLSNSRKSWSTSNNWRKTNKKLLLLISYKTFTLMTKKKKVCWESRQSRGVDQWFGRWEQYLFFWSFFFLMILQILHNFCRNDSNEALATLVCVFYYNFTFTTAGNFASKPIFTVVTFNKK